MMRRFIDWVYDDLLTRERLVDADDTYGSTNTVGGEELIDDE